MASRSQAAPRGVARFLAKPRNKPTGKTPPSAGGVTDADKPAEPGKATPALKIPELLSELEEHFKQLAIRVTYEALGGELGSGGLCKVRGQYRVIIDKRTTPSERVAMLLPLLLRFAPEDLSVSKALRDLLSRLRPADGGTAATEEATTDEATTDEATTDAAPAEPQEPSAAPPDEDDSVAEHLSPALAAADDSPPDDSAPPAAS